MDEAPARSERAQDARCYVPALDGLRFFAFFSVLVHHLPESGFSPVLARVQGFGWVGIDLFFVILRLEERFAVVQSRPA